MRKLETTDKQTFVEEGSEFRGTLISICPVVVRGKLDGEIKAPALNIADTGAVVGIVEAQNIRSEGTLAGKVDAEDIFLSGKVQDNTVIRAKNLEVKLAREDGKLEVTFGECSLEVGKHPDEVRKDEDEYEENKAQEIADLSDKSDDEFQDEQDEDKDEAA